MPHSTVFISYFFRSIKNVSKQTIDGYFLFFNPNRYRKHSAMLCRLFSRYQSQSHSGSGDSDNLFSNLFVIINLSGK